VYRRKDGRWEGRATVGMIGDRQARKSVYGKTRAEASEKLVALLARLKDGFGAPNDRMTVKQWVRRWTDQLDARLASRRMAYKTHVSYTQIARDYFLHPVVGLGRERLSTLNADRIQRWLDDLATQGVPAASVHHSLVVLRVALRAAQRADLIQRENPASLVSAPPYRRKKPKPFSGAGAADFLDAIREDRLYAMFLLDLTTALRPSELCGITWRAIDTEAKLLWVRQQLQREKGKGLVVNPTKTERSENPVPLTRVALRALERHKARMREERLALGTAWRGTDDPGAPDAYVFLSKTGRPLEGITALRAFKELLKATGTPDRSLYSGGRHSTATILRALGVPMPAIKDFLRHSRLATTEGYAAGDLAEQIAAAEKLDELLEARLG
jgi:integrase